MAVRIEGARLRVQMEQDGRAWLAWHVAALSRAQKIPDLKSLMSTSKREKQSPKEQEIATDQLFMAMGGDPRELRRIKLEKDAK